MGAAMSAFLVYLAWIVWRDSQSEEAVWVGAAILLVAVFVVALTTWSCGQAALR